MDGSQKAQRQAARGEHAFECIARVAFENEKPRFDGLVSDRRGAKRHHPRAMLTIIALTTASPGLRPIPIRTSTPRMAAGDNVDAARERVLDDFGPALAQAKVQKKGCSAGSSFGCRLVGASAVAAIGARSAGRLAPRA